MRFFNTAGACNPTDHYMLAPEGRLPELDELIARKSYFVVHAPRQTGKTTSMKALAKRLTAEGTYAGLYLSCERARAFPEDIAAAERSIWTALEDAALYALPEPLRPPPVSAPAGSLLNRGLAQWAQHCAKPLVLVFDEIDAVEGVSLKSVLSQLRDGYLSRDAAPFPHSLILCGVRDVRDYKVASGGGLPQLGSSSPFNIKMESLRLGNFSEAEVRQLYAQHTAETGQPFTEAALEAAWKYSCGQPWLTNALAYQIISKMRVPRATPIDTDHMAEAKERLIKARQTHLDSLLARLQEGRVRRVLEPIIAGSLPAAPTFNDDFSYVVDLGLVEPDKPPRIANAIYQEVILRLLADTAESSVTVDPRAYVTAEGRLDMTKLLEDFAEFWRQHGEILARGIGYQEAAPHLVLMGWLHRIVNGGGFIEREVGIGTERIDLLIRWPYTDTDGQRVWQTEALEIKAFRDRDKGKSPMNKGLAQLDSYLQRLGLSHGTLAFFDDRTKAPDIAERTRIEQKTMPSGRFITLLLG